MNNDKDLWTHIQIQKEASLAANQPRQRMIFNKLIKRLPEGSRILEIGFGDGYLLGLLSSRYQSYGCDISQENVMKMKEKLPKINFSTMDTDGKFPYEDNYFKGFVASEVLEHMSDEELSVCIREIWRVLQPGGTAIITFPANEDLSRNECFCPNCQTVFHKYGHKQSWNRKKIKKVFSIFAIKSISEYYNPFLGQGGFDIIAGKVMWMVQTFLNFITTFPDKIFHNKVFVVILKK